jgi:hypothetical protein
MLGGIVGDKDFLAEKQFFPKNMFWTKIIEADKKFLRNCVFG